MNLPDIIAGGVAIGIIISFFLFLLFAAKILVEKGIDKRDKQVMEGKVNALKALATALGKIHEQSLPRSTFLNKLARAHTPESINQLCNSIYSSTDSAYQPDEKTTVSATVPDAVLPTSGK